MSGPPIRLPVVYPIGFFKSSEDLFGKFNSQGDKWQMDIFTAPQNKTLFLNPSGVCQKNPKSGSMEGSMGWNLRYDALDGTDGVKAQMDFNSEQFWGATVAYNFMNGKDEHRALGYVGYGTKDPQTGLRRVLPRWQLAQQGEKAYTDKPIMKLGYRVNAQAYQADVVVGERGLGSLATMFDVDGKNMVFGTKLWNGGGKGKDDKLSKQVNYDIGFGLRNDAVRGYAKFAGAAMQPEGGKEKQTLTLLAQPQAAIGGVSCVMKAMVDPSAPTQPSMLGLTLQTPALGHDVKLGVQRVKGALNATAALVMKLPGKWVAGFGFGIDDVQKADAFGRLRVGIRLIQGSTPLPL